MSTADQRTPTRPQLARATTDTATEIYGYAFGCDGLMSSKDACQFLAGLSIDTLDQLARDGRVRKGKIPGGRKVCFCRRSVIEFARRMEQ